MNDVPKTFDWVRARAECSLQHVFLILREVIDADVKSMQALSKGPAFKLDTPTDTKLVVVKEYQSGEAQSVVLERMSNRIEVRAGYQQMPMFTAVPSLDASGSCRLHIKGDTEPSELWQVSRKALEDLFFDR